MGGNTIKTYPQIRKEVKRLRKQGWTFVEIETDFKKRGINCPSTGKPYSFGGLSSLVSPKTKKSKKSKTVSRRVSQPKKSDKGLLEIITGLEKLQIDDSEKWAALTVVAL